MNNLKTLFTPTKLAGKLIRRIALVALVSLILSFGLSYALFLPQLRDDAHDRAASASRVIMLSINKTLENLDGYANYMTSSRVLSAVLGVYNDDPTEENRLNVRDVLMELKSISSDMRAVVMTDGDGGYFQAGLLGQQDRELLRSSWITDSSEEPLAHNWSSFYVSDVEKPEDTIVRVSNCNIDGHAYTLSIFYDAGALMDRIDSLARSTYTGYILTDQHDGRPGIPFYESGTVGNAKEIASAYYEQEPYSAKDAKGHYFLITIPANGWRLVGFIDRATFNASLTPFIWLLFLICLALGILIVALFIPAVNRLLMPLGELGDTMRNVSSRGSDYYSPVQTDDEIGELSDIFNDMLDEMRINAERELEQQTREQHLTYNLMVAQINSHFFYNTLSVINSLARQGRTDDVIRANTALTTIFQDCLRPQSVRMGDTVAQEKSIVECYWVIESLDPNNQCSLLWDIPDGLLDKRIPKNIIQPLVENALFHGLDNAETGIKTGWVKVSLRQEGGYLELQVSNNGTPISTDTLVRLNDPVQAKNSGTHIGLSNIRRRLNMIYDGNASMTIRSDRETTVTILIPDEL